MQTLVLGGCRTKNKHTFRIHTHTRTHTLCSSSAAGWSRCGTPQWSTGVTTLQTHRSSPRFQSTPRFLVVLPVWLEAIKRALKHTTSEHLQTHSSGSQQQQNKAAADVLMVKLFCDPKANTKASLSLYPQQGNKAQNSRCVN